MKMLSAIVLPGILALVVSTANADPSPAQNTSGAQAMPSNTEPNSAPPVTNVPGTPGTAPTGVTTPTPNTSDTAGTPGTTVVAPPDGTTAPNTTDTESTPPATPPSSTEDMNATTPPPVAPVAPVPPRSEEAEPNMALPPPSDPATESVVPVTPEPGAPEGIYPVALVPSRVGVGFLAGGGFSDFVSSGIRNVTGDGGYWTARIVAGTREYLGAEVAYVGDARSISALGLGSNSRLISNGVEGNLRINIPIAQGPSLFEPFGFVGVGWSRYMITNNNAALSDFTSRDDILTLPFGGGLEFSYRGFLADARFTYRETYFNNLTQAVGGNLNNWGVGGQIGFEF